jgi:hypothetical protein
MLDTNSKDSSDLYAETMRPLSEDTAVGRYMNHLRAFALEHRDALGVPVGSSSFPAWDITNSLVEKAQRWMAMRYKHGLPLTFRELAMLSIYLDDAVAEEIHRQACPEHSEPCCGFFGMDKWTEFTAEIEKTLAMKF